jgi:hypothetical protein
MSGLRGSASGLELEVYYSNIKKSAIKNELDLLECLKELLFNFNDSRETYSVIDFKNFDKESGVKFKINSKNSGDLITFPNSDSFQLIQSHFASDAIYNFDYLSDDLSLDVEYKIFDSASVIQNVTQKNEILNLELDSTGETWETKVILRYLDKNGDEKNRFVKDKISSGFAHRDEGLEDSVLGQLESLTKIWYSSIGQ